MLSNYKFLVRVSKYRSILILVYEIILFTIFYLYNKFIFKNNTSILFISLVFIFPIILSILKAIIKNENLKKYHNLKTNYNTLIITDIKKGKYFNKFIEELKSLTNNVVIKTSDVNQLITLGKYNNINILIDSNNTIISIDNTYIKYQYIYGYIGDNTTKYDFKAISNKTLDRFYNLLLKRIKVLINNEFNYTEYYFGKTYNGCILKNHKETLYQIKIKEKAFLRKEKEIHKIINT